MQSRRRFEGEEGGFAIIWMTIFLLTLVGMMGFAIDVAHWWLWANRAQHAADAGALAGVVFMPDNFGQANSVATLTAADNGFSGAQVNTTANPSQLKVTTSKTVGNFFASILGVDTTTVTRSAIAEYRGPIPMGSPVNGLGNEPRLDCNPGDFPGGAGDADYLACVTREESDWVNDSTGQGQFWGHVSGPLRDKATGDAFQSMTCATSSDGCPSANANSDYATEGYIYAIRVPEGTTGTMTVQAFDPAMIGVGNQCTAGTLTGNDGTPYSPAQIPANLVPDAKYRYASGQSSPFCTGDESNSATQVTTFILRSPDSTPWNNTDNPPVSGCTKQFLAFNGALTKYLNPTYAQYSTVRADGYRIHEVFRQWVDLCQITNPGPGDYLLQIKTNAPLGSPESVNTSQGSDGNRWALRTAITTGSGPTMSGAHANISVTALGKLGIYANADGANTQFYLARVLPDSAGRSLLLRFYDTGDAAASGQMKILPPSESGLGSFTGCTYTGPNAGGQTSIASECKAVGLQASNGYNGKWMSITVPIPNGYTCNPSSLSGCWIRVQIIFPSGTQVQDTTTWTANILGDPVRLVA